MDEILVKKALEGDQQAFTHIVRKYERYVFTLAWRIVKNREDAHEVAQDAFLKAFRYLDTFRGACKFQTWLYKITYSAGLNFLRKKQLDIVSLDDEMHPIMLPERSETEDLTLEKQEQSEWIQAAIQQLSPDDATIITLFYLMEQKIGEICIAMEITETNAKTKLSRARQRLKIIMESQPLN
jgi:RNA polymerase sigma-70 factor (ECF subfamily)